MANRATTAIAQLNFLLSIALSSQNRKHLSNADWRGLLSATTLRKFEAASVCAVNGHRDPEQYYRFSQADLSSLHTPLLVLHAKVAARR